MTNQHLSFNRSNLLELMGNVLFVVLSLPYGHFCQVLHHNLYPEFQSGYLDYHQVRQIPKFRSVHLLSPVKRKSQQCIRSMSKVLYTFSVKLVTLFNCYNFLMLQHYLYIMRLHLIADKLSELLVYLVQVFIWNQQFVQCFKY